MEKMCKKLKEKKIAKIWAKKLGKKKDLISLAEIGARMEFLRQKKFNSNEN